MTAGFSFLVLVKRRARHACLLGRARTLLIRQRSLEYIPVEFGAAVLAFIGGYLTNISMTDDGVLQRFYSAVF